MILNAQDKQFKLAETGEILFQQDPTNPLPGIPVARLVKGETLLAPCATFLEGLLPETVDRQAADEALRTWLERHIHFTLEPLFRLVAGEDLVGAAKDIALRIQEAMGIIPRSALEDLIPSLGEEGRALLRARKVRMGPLLVFLPELNKPAAVRMRAVLLTLWQDKPLPAIVPKDGMVSLPVVREGEGCVDPDYFRSIGYPVYGPRAIRVDMLDRVICAIYDSAKEGKFQAQHKMAEWLGSNILDLYSVLESMGHKKIHDPSEEKPKVEEASTSDPSSELSEKAIVPEPVETSQETVPAEKLAEPPSEGGADAPPAPLTAPSEKPKPQLATFSLKRGRADQERRPRPAHHHRPREDGKEGGGAAPSEDKNNKGRKVFSQSDKPAFKAGEGRKGKSAGAEGEGRPDFKNREKGKNRPDRERNRGDRDRPQDRGEDRIVSSIPASRVADSPFAILQNLKFGHDKT